jgi:hypothetical protein
MNDKKLNEKSFMDRVLFSKKYKIELKENPGTEIDSKKINPSVIYFTTGLSEMNLPELVTFNAPKNIALPFIRYMALHIKNHGVTEKHIVLPKNIILGQGHHKDIVICLRLTDSDFLKKHHIPLFKEEEIIDGVTKPYQMAFITPVIDGKMFDQFKQEVDVKFSDDALTP